MHMPTHAHMHAKLVGKQGGLWMGSQMAERERFDGGLAAHGVS